MVEELLNSLPDSVLNVLAELKEEVSTESIWLVGSRANQTSTPHSDWDLLVFSSVEPEVVPARRKDVDVIRVGPSRQTFLLEGKGSDFMLSFADWRWREIDEVNAIYVGRRFIDYPPGARDAGDPVFSETEQPAYRVWSKHRAIS
ncbi:MAG: nucleotidyltransferase domain-containing protein [Rubrivivax sp.]|nr:nucleotidyltransferase domain-containing protein [Pyrinomonadaceae bacterium]